jgi:hypothetical protein
MRNVRINDYEHLRILVCFPCSRGPGFYPVPLLQETFRAGGVTFHPGLLSGNHLGLMPGAYCYRSAPLRSFVSVGKAKSNTAMSAKRRREYATG